MAKYQIRKRKAQLLIELKEYLKTGKKSNVSIEYMHGVYLVSTKDFKYQQWYFTADGEFLRLYKPDLERIIIVSEYRWLDSLQD